MAHYLYKPHLHAPGFITTPDIIIDRLFRVTGNGQQGVDLVSVPVNSIGSNPELQCGDKTVTVIPAVFLVAAGAGALVSIGAEVLMAETRLTRVSRFAWRHKHLDDHLDRIRLLIRAGQEEDAGLSLGSLPALSEILERFGEQSDNLPRGVMACIPAPSVERQCRLPETIALSLSDEETGSTMEYRLSLVHAGSDRWKARPQSRYAVGPQTGEVKHFI